MGLRRSKTASQNRERGRWTCRSKIIRQEYAGNARFATGWSVPVVPILRRIQSAMATQPQSIEPSTQRRYPIGVEVVNEIDKSAPVHARVWAPGRKSVELVNDDDPTRNSDSRLAPE